METFNVNVAGVSEEFRHLNQTRTLTSLAILKVDIDSQTRSYPDYLVPFVTSAIIERKIEVVTDTIVSKLLQEEFGLNVPIRGIQHVLRRMLKQGYLKKDGAVFQLAEPRLDNTLAAKRRDAQLRIQRVYEALCSYVRELQLNLIWKDSDAATAILGFLSRFGVDCLKTYVFNTTLPEVPPSAPKSLYIVSRFVKNAFETNHALFEDFIVLVKGQMYANALTCPDLESLEKKFDHVIFYLDTPIALNLLGLHGEGSKLAAEELVTLVLKLKGRLAIFEHTRTEIHGTIKYALSKYDDPASTSRILREVRASGTPVSDLILHLDQFPERLAKFGITFKPAPEYQQEVQIDEIAFEEVLAEEIQYHGEHALHNDINSVRSIYVFRRGFEPRRLEDAKAVFVTNNQGFAKIAFEFGKTHNSSREISPVMTDYSLANVAWLKAPMERPSLPEKETLAMCYAALEPSKELFSKYVKQMEHLAATGQISADDHAVLRCSPIAQRELMNYTLGDEEGLTGAGIREILQRVKSSMLREQSQAFDAERCQLVETHKKEEENLQITLKQHMEVNRLIEDRNSRLEKRLFTASQRAKSISRAIIILVMIVISGLLFLGAAWFSNLLPTGNASTPYVKAVFFSISCFAMIWGWSNWVWGITVRGLMAPLQKKIERNLFKWLTGQYDIK